MSSGRWWWSVFQDLWVSKLPPLHQDCQQATGNPCWTNLCSQFSWHALTKYLGCAWNSPAALLSEGTDGSCLPGAQLRPEETFSVSSQTARPWPMSQTVIGRWVWVWYWEGFSSPLSVGLELTTLRSRVTCFTHWASQVPLKFSFLGKNISWVVLSVVSAS